MIVLWRVTTVCNLACGFCAFDRRLPGTRQMLEAERMQPLLDLLGQLRQATGRRVLLSWIGGEPLLWRQRAQVDARARAAGLDLSLTSHGLALEQPAVRAGLLRDYQELTLSLDAAAATHDQLRGRAGLSARVLAGLRTLVEERAIRGSALRLRVNSVLMRSTIAAWPELALALAAEGIDQLSFNLLGGRDRPEFFATESVQPQQWADFCQVLPELHAALSARGVRLLGQGVYLQRLQAAVDAQSWPVADCAPGEQFLFVDESGRIAPCAFTSEQYGVPMGGLRHWQELLDLPARFRQLRTRAPAAACGDCPSTQVFGKFEQARPVTRAQPALCEE